MNRTTQRIFKAMETETLVFSSQVVADSYVYAFAREYGAVIKDHALSWDRFKELCTKLPQNVQKATDPDRRLFISLWASENKKDFDKLRYYSNSRFPESVPAFEKSLAQELPKLCKAYDRDGKIKEDLIGKAPADLINDIHLLVPAYRRFLDKVGLYETSLQSPDFSLHTECVLVFPETFRDCDVVDAQKVCRSINLDFDGQIFKGYEVFDNSICEIRSVLRRVRTLLEEKANTADIAITCADLKAYRPYLEYEASLRDLDLDYQDSKTLASFPPGRFIINFLKARRENWSLEAFSRFAMDPMSPFLNSREFAWATHCAAKLKMNKGPLSEWERRFSLLVEKPDYWATEEEIDNNSRALEAIKLLNTSIEVFDKQKPSEALMTFSKAVLKDGVWTAKEDNVEKTGTYAAVFGSCIEEMKSLEKKAELLGLTDREKLLDLFCDVLENVKYLANPKRVGIKVYSYPLSAGLCAKEHFVLNLSERAVKCMRDPYPFLPEDALAGMDIGSSIVGAYLSSGATLSGSEESFSGPSVLPSMFMEEGRNKRGERYEDSFDFERKCWTKNAFPKEMKVTAKQQENLLRAKAVNLVFDSVEKFPDIPKPIRLGVSSLKDLEECPFKVFASDILGLSEVEYEVQMDDPALVGNILHRTVQRAVKEAGKIESIKTQRLNEIFKEEVYIVTQNSNNAPPKEYLDSIYKKYELLIKEFTKSDSPIFGFEFAAMESKTKGLTTFGNLEFTGRADLLLKNKAGDYAVIDMKKSADDYYKAKNIDGTSLQLVLYSKIVEGNKEFGKLPIYGAYYSFSDGRYKRMWPDGGFSKDWSLSYVLENAEKRLSQVSDMVGNNEFLPRREPNKCKFCKFANLCRGGYEIK